MKLAKLKHKNVTKIDIEDEEEAEENTKYTKGKIRLNSQGNKSSCIHLVNNTIITHHINECLKNDKFKNCRYKKIEKIFQNSTGDIKFIKQSIDQNYILFPYLNLSTLSNEKLQELLNKINNSEKQLIRITLFQ